jgi:hypothetical protein
MRLDSGSDRRRGHSPRAAFLQDMRDILEYGTEEDFVALLKKQKPDIGKEELQVLIKQFHVCARERRGLC